VLGLEAAGTVVAVGEGIEGISAGQRVRAMGSTNQPGFYAELAAVPATRVTVLPDGIALTEAAVLPADWLSPCRPWAKPA